MQAEQAAPAGVVGWNASGGGEDGDRCLTFFSLREKLDKIFVFILAAREVSRRNVSYSKNIYLCIGNGVYDDIKL